MRLLKNIDSSECNFISFLKNQLDYVLKKSSKDPDLETIITQVPGTESIPLRIANMMSKIKYEIKKYED